MKTKISPKKINKTKKSKKNNKLKKRIYFPINSNKKR